jgi:hypothetical protein
MGRHGATSIVRYFSQLRQLAELDERERWQGKMRDSKGTMKTKDMRVRLG